MFIGGTAAGSVFVRRLDGLFFTVELLGAVLEELSIFWFQGSREENRENLLIPTCLQDAGCLTCGVYYSYSNRLLTVPPCEHEVLSHGLFGEVLDLAGDLEH